MTEPEQVKKHEGVNMFDDKGFTLIELLIALAIAALVMTGIYSTYMNQQQAYLVQKELVAAQQNLRASMYLIGRDLRMAGFREEINDTSVTGPIIKPADRTLIHFIVGNKEIEYSLFDSLGDGDTELGRRYYDKGETESDKKKRQAVAENIDALDFVYLGEDGSRLDDNDGAWDGTDSEADIVSVEVTIVARVDRIDINYTDNQAYTNKRGDVILPAQNDNFRRRVLTQRIQCRNLALIIRGGN
ncbi:MAG: hypothetical protein B6245_18900 [Desulfobacteraceae bacterium 4572_88]|nr:MAG: hypothetical protein B6245_18900 [Desulfobacteraceae bacterium 4572_88]